MHKQKSWLLVLLVIVALVSPAGADVRTVFEDGFEASRTCWPGAPFVGRLDLCFDAPFEASPPQDSGTTDVHLPKRQVDLVIAMDTTYSMTGEIDNLKASAITIVNEFSALAPDGAIGIVGYDDYPYEPYGSLEQGDKAFYLLHRVMTITSPEGQTSIQAAFNAYTTQGGGDVPESGWEMVFQVATGAGSGSGIYAVPPFDSSTAPPAAIPEGEETGMIGGVGFRPGAIPILIWITDVRNHNSPGGDPYGPIPGVSPAFSNQSLSLMSHLGGRIIGIMSGEDAREDLTTAAIQTGAIIPPDAWGTTSRPSGCGANQCCTGIYGAGVATVASQCPLVYEISSNGTGLESSVLDGINHAVERLGVAHTDIAARLVDDPRDGVDAVDAFIERVEANDAGPHPCTQGLTTIDTDLDGKPDTFVDVKSGSYVCFDVVVKTNQAVPSTGEPQYYSAVLEFIGDGVTVLESREIHFRVQP